LRRWFNRTFGAGLIAPCGAGLKVQSASALRATADKSRLRRWFKGSNGLRPGSNAASAA
jgi:hypothetical protein